MTKRKLMMGMTVRRVAASIAGDFQWRQAVHDFHRFQADRHHAQEQLQRITRITHRFDGPVVGVVDDAAVRILLYTLALHYPIQRGFAVYDVVVGFGRDAADGDVRVVDQPGQIFFAIGFRHFHLFHAPKTLPLVIPAPIIVIPAQAGIQRLGIAKIEHLPIGAQHLGALVYRHGFIIQVQLGQLASGL